MDSAIEAEVNDSLPPTPRARLRFDGSCRPNPGPMGIGYTVELEPVADSPGSKARVVCRVGAQIGKGTNNEAEYSALIAGLRHCLRLGLWSVTIFSDSKLIVQQIRGKWKVREPHLKKLHGEASVLLGLFTDWSIEHVYREHNAEADDLSRKIHFEEPDQGRTPAFGTIPRKFHFWQAAALRFWWKAGLCRSGYLLARIFNVDHGAVEQICDGRSYKNANFDTLPWCIREAARPAYQSCPACRAGNGTGTCTC